LAVSYIATSLMEELRATDLPGIFRSLPEVSPEPLIYYPVTGVLVYNFQLFLLEKTRHPGGVLEAISRVLTSLMGQIYEYSINILTDKENYNWKTLEVVIGVRSKNRKDLIEIWRKASKEFYSSVDIEDRDKVALIFEKL